MLYVRTTVLVLLLSVGVAEAARWRGIGVTSGFDVVQVTLRGRFINGGAVTGAFRCKGKTCPFHRGKLTWACDGPGSAGGIRVGKSGCVGYAICETDGALHSAYVNCPVGSFGFYLDRQ